MSEKYEKSWTTYHIPLNSSDNDVLRIGCALFYHFLHTNVNHQFIGIRTADCKPMILKMHLEL
ncbi:hypothetical protein DOY81_014230 [Sarcophaga bullata]|nr:hypothetical protein DOY81_014230 [Sarcophaga bullata]